MKLKLNGSILILFLMIQMNRISSRILDENSIKFFSESNQQYRTSEDQFDESNQQNDKNEIMKRIEESNNYHRKMNELELEFDYFNMLTSRKKKSSSVKIDPKMSSTKNQLIPPYMLDNYQELIKEKSNNDQPNKHQPSLAQPSKEKFNLDEFDIDRTNAGQQLNNNDQFNNDQSSVQLKSQFDNQFNNDQFTDTDRSNIDKIIKIDKLNENQSINKSTSTNLSTTIDEPKTFTNWFSTLISKFGIKLGSSSDNSNATINNQTAIKQKLNYSEKLNYYSDYDVMMGIRIGYSLFSLFALFTLFITYKSYCNSRKEARHRRESEKKRKADDQSSSSKRIPPQTLNSVRRGSGQMSKTFVKIKTNREIDSSE